VYLANKKDCKSLFFLVLGPCGGPFTLKEVEILVRIIIQGLKIANFSKLGLCPHKSTPAISLWPKMIKNTNRHRNSLATNEVSHHTPKGTR